MRLIKIFFILFVFIVLPLTTCFGNEAKEKLVTEMITAIYDGKAKQDVLLMINGMGYISIDSVIRYYHAEPTWHQISKKVSLDFKGKKVEFTENSDLVIINKIKRKLRKKSRSISGKLMVPLEVLITMAFADVTNRTTEWNFQKKILRITKNSKDNSRQKRKTTFPTTSNAKNLDLIVIDPGHGGKDPGATLKKPPYEKDFNLLISKKVSDLLKKKYKKKVILTRKKDIFIPLYERAKIANKYNADIFVSIHANACTAPKQRGFEIYFLSEKASDREAERVAKQENAALEYEKEMPNNDINIILWSMAINEFMNESSELCYFIQQSVTKRTGMPDRGVRQAGFAVLRGAKMPSVLIETGYMTNKKDLKLLKNKNFQEKITHAITEGIIQYEKRLLTK